MFQLFVRHRVLLFLLLMAAFIKLFSLNEAWVEKYYTYGIYLPISKTLRALFGWLSFSIGDLLYAAAVIFLIFKLYRFIKNAFNKKPTPYFRLNRLLQVLKIVLWIYIIFNVFWGLNYNRSGISKQLGLNVNAYSDADLLQLTNILQQRLCYYGDQVNTNQRDSLNTNKWLFSGGVIAFKKAETNYKFFKYSAASIKPSLLTPLGHYFGFTGYYNPFTAEAQLKTSVPVFIKPFVLCHEIAHQLGYAKENEANLVSFLVAKESQNMEFRYSVYFDMYTYALSDLMYANPKQALLLLKTAHPQFLKDRKDYRAYITNNQNAVEPLVSRFYDQYLKLNNQPKGKGTYNQVVAWLIAYMKKYGAEAI